MSNEHEKLSADERKLLLSVAREAIQCRLEDQPLETEAVPAALQRPAGAFVSLHRHGELRGCIGTLDASKPLVDSVRDAAVAAATRDHRFSQLTRRELDEIDIEISVLGPFLEVRDVDEIEIGRDGLYLRAGMHGGLLLPQVASERNWDRSTFLEHICVKAGVPPQAWKRPDARLERFTAEVFGEGDLAPD